MKAKSVLEYDDVISSLNYREKIGIEKGIEKARIKFVRNCHKYNMNIEQIIALTGLTEKELSDILAKF